MPIFEDFWDVKKLSNFFDPQISEFWAINWHRCVTIYKFMEQFFKQILGIWCLSYGPLSNWPFLGWHINHWFTTWRFDNFDAMSFGNLWRTFWPTKRLLLRIFVIYIFLVNWKIVNFFVELLHILCMVWEVKIDMSGQSNDGLRVCNVKMKNFLQGQKWGTFPRM